MKNSAIRRSSRIETIPEVNIPVRSPTSVGSEPVDFPDGPIRERIFAVGRVEDWRGDVRFGLSVAPRFLVGVPHEPNHNPVSSPRRIKRSVQISRTALSCLLHVKVYGLSGWVSFLSWGVVTNQILIKESQFVIHPRHTPLGPAEASSFPGAHDVPSDLHLHPPSNVSEAVA